MKYLYDLAKCFGLPLHKYENSIVMRVRSWEQDENETDGIYLRFFADGDDYAVYAEAHIHNYLAEQNMVVEDRFYPGLFLPSTKHTAFQYGLDAETFRAPVIKVKNFFDGCKYVKNVDGDYVFSGTDCADAMEFLTDWAMEKSRYVIAKEDYLYVSIPNAIEMSAIMQTATLLTTEDVEYSITNYPNYNERSYHILKFFLKTSAYEKSRYVTVNKIGPNLFILTAFERGYCYDNKMRNFFDALKENKEFKDILRFKDGTVIVPAEHLNSVVSWCL